MQREVTIDGFLGMFRAIATPYSDGKWYHVNNGQGLTFWVRRDILDRKAEQGDAICYPTPS